MGDEAKLVQRGTIRARIFTVVGGAKEWGSPTEGFIRWGPGIVVGKSGPGVRVGRGRACGEWADPGPVRTGPVVNHWNVGQ